MVEQDELAARWRHPTGMDVLKNLGIVQRSDASISEDGDTAPNHIGYRLSMEENDGFDSTDEETTIDRVIPTSLLHNSSSPNEYNQASNRRVSTPDKCASGRMCMVMIAFCIIGLCTSMAGPTLKNLPEQINNNRLGSIEAILAASSFGALIGIGLAASCSNFWNMFSVTTLALLFCSFATLAVPWCSQPSTISLAFMLQGLAWGFVERSSFSLFYAFWKRRYSLWIVFYFALTLGATISPLITASFLLRDTNLAISSASAPTIENPKLLVARYVRSGNDSIATLCNGATGENSTGLNCPPISNPAAIVPKKKPTVSDATELDQHKSRTEEKQQMQQIQSQEKTPTVAVILKTPAELNLNETSNSTDTPVENQPIEAQSNSNSNVMQSAATTTLSPTTGTSVPISTSTSTTSTSTSTSTTTSSTTTTTRTTTTTTIAATTVNWTPSRPISAEIVTESISSAVAPSLVESGMISNEMSSVSTKNETSNLTSVDDSIWDGSFVGRRIASLRNFQLAYVIVAAVSLALTSLFGVLFCVMPCRSVRSAQRENSAEWRFLASSLSSSSNSRYVICAASLLTFFISGTEATTSLLLTVYSVEAMSQSQISGISVTCTFWFCVSVARLTSAILQRRLLQVMPIVIILSCTLLTTGIMVVFRTWTVLWLGVSAFGLCVGFLTPLLYCWLDQQLAPAPWLSTVWCLAGQTGRLAIPLATVAGVSQHSPKVFLLALLVATLLACISFALTRSSVKEAMRLSNIEQTRQIKFSDGNSLFEYRNIATEYRDDQDDLVHFDRSQITNGHAGSTLRSLL